jgi:hypothetical protein
MYNSKLRSNNTLGVKGVIYLQKYNKYTVTIVKEGKRMYMGRYDTIEEATEAATSGREMLHKEFARHE